jgi:CBS-domain-containing membrane protein
MEVAEVMSREVQCCAPGDSLAHAATLMWDHDCGCLPVCIRREGKARTVGLITDRDICMCALFEHAPLAELLVTQAMTKHVLGCQPGDSLEQAERAMQGGRVRRLPVLSSEGDLLGMISLADLAREAEREGSNRIFGRDSAASDVGHTLAAICAPLVPRG